MNLTRIIHCSCLLKINIGSPAAGWGHLRLITSKGAGPDLSQGGVAVHFTLDKCGHVSYSSKANDGYKPIPYPKHIGYANKSGTVPDL